MKTAVATADPAGITVEVETADGVQTITVDPNADLGSLTPDEFRLINAYIVRSGLLPDYEAAWAGAAILVHISRQVDVDPDSLLQAVT